MGNYVFGNNPRSNNDIELQSNAADQEYITECECMQTPEAKCLHWAIRERNLEKVNEIIKDSAGGCLLARNSDGEIPLHTACKDDENNDIVKILLGYRDGMQKLQLIATNEIFGNTPLHVAACLGNEKIVHMILKCKDGKSLLEKTNKMKDTPVHGAASRGHLSVLELMYQTTKDCIHFKGRFKGLPLHSACGYGRLEVVKKLLEWDDSILNYTSVPVILPAFTRTTEPLFLDPKEKENVKNTIDRLSFEEAHRKKHDHYTPLTRACQFGHDKIVEYLLEKGAMAHPLALIKAIEGLYRECVELILFQETYRKDLLHFTYEPDGSQVLTTPFRELIKHMPEMAESVLQRCVDLERFLVNSESFKIKLNYEFVDDNGQNWNKKNGAEMMNIVYTRHHSEETDYDVPVKKSKNIGFNKDTHPLSLMVEYKRDKLLTHPVVAALIHDKWKSIYGVVSFIQWLLYTAFVCCTTILLFKLPNPSSIFCSLTEGENKTQLEGNASCSSNATESDMDCIDILDQESDFTVIALAIVMILYSLLRLLLEASQLVNSLRLACSVLQCGKQLCWDLLGAMKRVNYIWDLINWVEVPLFVLSIIFSSAVLSNYTTFCLSAWQWQIGVAVLWLSWIEFIFLSTQFQLIGVHALMFIRVLKTIVKFIPLALLLIIAFGLTFHFLLYQPDLMASPYFSPGYSFLKTLSMTAGDVGSDSFFGLDIRGMTHDTSHLQYVQLSTFFWLLSLIFMTILLSNLLIGLAVGDIQTIYAQANIEKLTLQVNYVLTAESQFPKCLRKLGNKSMKEFEPNKPSKIETVKKELIYLIWGGVHYDSPENIKRLVSESTSRK